MEITPRTKDPGNDGPALAARIRSGDRAAFKELFYAQYEALCRFACGYVRSLEIAEDLVQEVFLDLWKRRDSWALKRSPKAFLFGAVRNQAFKHRRYQRAQSRLKEQVVFDGPWSLESPEQTVHRNEFAKIAEQVINELPERRREIFVLSREHELTYAEIASTLAISVKTVETQMGRALQHLRNRLSSCSHR